MMEIGVELRPATAEGRLYPRYDDESGIVAVESKVPREWPFGVDVDGNVVFDLDEHRVLANFDLHIPRRRWEKTLGERLPTIAPQRDLAFTEQAVAQKSFHLPLRVRCDRNNKMLLVTFGDAEVDEEVQLSGKCFARLADSNLVGFVIGLAD